MVYIQILVGIRKVKTQVFLSNWKYFVNIRSKYLTREQLCGIIAIPKQNASFAESAQNKQQTIIGKQKG